MKAVPKSPRVAIYVRQSVQEDQGIAQQIAECQREATAKGWHVVGVYEDNKTSATTARGAGTAWARMLTDIDAGKVDTILAVHAARLLRRTIDVVEVTKPTRAVRVVTIRDNIDTATAGGRIMLAVLVAMAEEEIAEKEARAVPYRARRRKQGHPTAGLVPYGYRWVPKLNRDSRGTRYEVVQEEAEAIKYMSSELLGGADLGAIAAALNEGASNGRREKLPESTRSTRAGVRWTSTTVRRILVSPFPAALLPPPMPDGVCYRADRFALSECTPGAWEAILTEDAVAAARGRLLDPSRRTHDGDTRAKWLLSGIGECGRCGGPLRKVQTKTTATSVRGYRCTAGCFQRPAALIEEYVENAAVEVLSAPGLFIWVDEGRHDIGALRTRRDALAATRAEWLDLAKAGELTPHEWVEMKAGWDAELLQIDAAIAEAVSVDPAAAFVGADDVRAIWEGLSLARRRAVLGALVFSVQVFPVGKGRRVHTIEATEGTVLMSWKRTERRVRIDAERSTSSIRPRVPIDAQDAISRALDNS